MAKAPRNIGRVAQNLEFRLPADEATVLVRISDWRSLMARVEQCGDPPQHLEAIGWCSLSIGVTCLITALTLPLSAEMVRRLPNGNEQVNYAAVVTEIILGAAALGGIIGGIASLIFAHRDRKKQTTIRKMIVADMQVMLDHATTLAAHLEAPAPPLPPGQAPTAQPFAPGVAPIGTPPAQPPATGPP